VPQTQGAAAKAAAVAKQQQDGKASKAQLKEKQVAIINLLRHPEEKIPRSFARQQTSPAVGRRARLIENPIVVRLYKSMTTSRIGCERDHAPHEATLRSKRRESQPPSLLKSSSFPVAEFGNLAKSTDPKSLSAKKSLCSVPPIQRQLPLTYL
jgi:hypothetical protein